MKNTTKKLTIAAAFLVVATGVASAEVMKADIPFAFRAGRTVMAPGTYTVEVNAAQHIVILRNRDAGQNAMLVPGGARDVSKEWKDKGDPVMGFECGASRCALTRIWNGHDSSTVTIPQPGGGSDHAPLTLIRLVRPNRN